MQQVPGHIPVPLPATGQQQTVAGQVVGVDILLAVACTVVLLQPPRSLDQQVSAADELSVEIVDVLLHEGTDVRRPVQHPHD
jgi:hypothetical protein